MKQLTLCICIALIASGCGVMAQQHKSRSTVEYDDGVNAPRRMTVTHQGRGKAASVGIPMAAGMVVGGHPGAFGPSYGMGNLCTVHPDYCGTTVVTQHVGDPQLERRVAANEKRLENVGKSYRVLVREGRKTNKRVSELEQQQKVLIKWGQRSYYLDEQQCTALKENPDAIKNEKLSTKVNKVCDELLGADAAEDGGNS